MTIRLRADGVGSAAAAFQAWARWPGRDEERLRLYVEGDERTLLLSADTGVAPAASVHQGPSSHVLVDVSGYVIRTPCPIGSGVVDIVALGERSAVITVDQEPRVLLVQDEELEAIAPAVIGLGGVPQLRRSSTVRWLAVVDVDSIVGIHAYSALSHLELRAAVWLTDLEPLADLPGLESLSLKRARRLENLGPIASCSLVRLDLQGCERVSDLSALAEMSRLEYLNVWRLPLLEDLAALGGLPALRELQFSRSRKLHDLSPLATLSALEILCLAHCEAVEDLSPLATLPRLVELDLSGCERLKDLSPIASHQRLKRLELGGCRGLRDIGPLARASELEHLDLTSCDGVTDLKPIAGLTGLTRLLLGGDRSSGSTRRSLSGLEGSSVQHLTLTRCGLLEDLRPLAEASQLEHLELVRCQALEDLSPLSRLGLHTLDLEGCVALGDVAQLGGLRRLQRLCLNGCEGVTSLEGLESLALLEALELKGCSKLVSVEPLDGLSALRLLDLTDCGELADPDRWGPLWTLPGLDELRGSFPSTFRAHVLAAAAVARSDADSVRASLGAWMDVASGDPTAPGLLSAVGSACALVGAHLELGALLELARTSSCHDVDGLLAAAAGCAEAAPVREGLLAMARSGTVVPPAALSALPEALALVADQAWAEPLVLGLRDAVVSSLAAVVDRRTEDPGWANETAMVLRHQLDDRRTPRLPAGYGVTPEVQASALGVIGRAWARDEELPVSEALFDSIASRHGKADELDVVRHAHRELLRLALGAQGRMVRLSALIHGVSVSVHRDWAVAALDALLERTSVVDADVSELEAAAAQAQVRLGRWRAAGELALGIVRPHIRDSALDTLADGVIDSGTEDAARLGLSWASALSDPVRRTTRIEAIGRHPNTASDPVAYAQAVALLAAFPRAQQRVVRASLDANPALVGAPVLADTGPITDREHALVREALARAGVTSHGQR